MYVILRRARVHFSESRSYWSRILSILRTHFTGIWIRYGGEGGHSGVLIRMSGLPTDSTPRRQDPTEAAASQAVEEEVDGVVEDVDTVDDVKGLA